MGTRTKSSAHADNRVPSLAGHLVVGALDLKVHARDLLVRQRSPDTEYWTSIAVESRRRNDSLKIRSI
jgi:hypothetical protein